MFNPLPQTISIFEVGPRDGLQNEPLPITTEDKLVFIQKLLDSGHQNIEVTAFVSPKWVPQMADAQEVVKGLENLHNPNQAKFWALIPNNKGLDRALEAGIKNIAVFTAASQTFNKKNINQSIEDSLKNIQEVTQSALEQKVNVRGYVSTCFTCPYEGKIMPQEVLPILQTLLDLGISQVSIGDTIGAATPLDVTKLLEQATLTHLPIQQLALHMHDTYGTALANCITGLQMGITTFDTSSGGLGGCPYAPGASGNLATEDLIYCLSEMGINTGISLEQQAQASLFIQQKLGKLLPSKQLTRLSATKTCIS